MNKQGRNDVLNRFCDLLGVDKTVVQALLVTGQGEHYNVEYFFDPGLCWYTQSKHIIEKLIRDWLPARPRYCLDLGCGVGFYQRFWLQTVGVEAYIGVDLSKSVLMVAKSVNVAQNSRRLLVCASGNWLPLPDCSIDMVFSSEVLEHVSEPQGLLDEISRILIPGGKLLLTTSTFQYYLIPLLIRWGYRDLVKRHDLSSFLKRLVLYFKGYANLQARSQYMLKGLEHKDHIYAFTKGDLVQMVTNANLVLEECIFFNAKDVFPHPVFSPLNALCRAILPTRSKLYGSNIAILCSKRRTCDKH